MSSDSELLQEWSDTINSIQGEDWPIDQKIEEIDNLITVLRENKEKAGNVYKAIATLLIKARLKLVNKQKKKENEKEKKKKQDHAATQIQKITRGRQGKQRVKKIKVENLVKEYFEKPPSTKFKIQTEPQGSLLKPDGTFEVPKDKRFALSNFQRQFWLGVDEQVSKAPPGFKHVKPSRKPLYDEDGKPKGGRRKKTKRRKRRKRRRTRKRRTKSRRKRRTKTRRTRKR